LKRLTLFLGFLDVFGAYRCWIWHFFHSNDLPDDAPILIFLMVLLTSVYWLGLRLFPWVTVSLHKGVFFGFKGCLSGVLVGMFLLGFWVRILLDSLLAWPRFCSGFVVVPCCVFVLVLL